MAGDQLENTESKAFTKTDTGVEKTVTREVDDHRETVNKQLTEEAKISGKAFSMSQLAVGSGNRFELVDDTKSAKSDGGHSAHEDVAKAGKEGDKAFEPKGDKDDRFGMPANVEARFDDITNPQDRERITALGKTLYRNWQMEANPSGWHTSESFGKFLDDYALKMDESKGLNKTQKDQIKKDVDRIKELMHDL